MINNESFYMCLFRLFNIDILPNNDSSTYDGLDTPDFFDILEMCDLFDTCDCGYTLLS